MSIPAEQREIAAFLQRLAGGPPVETHISAVFVGPIAAWKMKKAVRLPFLDFSTLPERRRFLERELELNKLAAPDIYRDLAAIVRGQHGRLALTPEPGEREALEWILRMAPIPARDFLDAVAERGDLTPGLQDALGDCVAAYHARLPPVFGSDSPARSLGIAEGNVPSALAVGLPEPVVREWITAVRAALTTLAPWLAARDDAGFVRRGHGDLHLGNLCLWRGRPVPFDALEFDEALATTDIGYDAAFLLMDLDRRAGRAAANRVMNRYIARNGDVGLVRGLPVFLSMRAMVLAHVRAARGDEAGSSAYSQAASDYLHQAAPIVVAIGGLQATGKSTLARALAPDIGSAPGALLLRSDELRKRLFSVAPEQRLPAAAYADTVNTQVNAAILDATRLAAEAGHAVVADATFLDPALRTAIADTARKAGVRFRGIWLEAPLAVLERRINARRSDASDATAAVLYQASAKGTKPADWTTVDATDAGSALAQARALLRD